MCCGNKTKHTCGQTVYATCTKYEGTVNSQSSLVDESCLDSEETTQDIYNQLEEIQSSIDLSDLGKTCLNYPGLTVKKVLLVQEEKICELSQELEDVKNGSNICNTLITECGLDLGDLVDQCDNPPKTLAELLQIILNSIKNG